MKQTAVEWLIEQIKVDQKEQAFSEMAWTKIFEQAKEMEREQMASNCSQQDKPTMIFGEHQIQILEISDEEIEKGAYKYDENQVVSDYRNSSTYGDFIEGAKWYREQLKQK